MPPSSGIPLSFLNLVGQSVGKFQSYTKSSAQSVNNLRENDPPATRTQVSSSVHKQRQMILVISVETHYVCASL